MASRLHQRNTRDSLFAAYDSHSQSQSQSRSRPSSAAPPSPGRHTQSPYSSPYAPSQPSAGSGRSSGEVAGSFRTATPDPKGRYASSVYESLESQNDEQVGLMTEKVKMLKNISIAIGDEIRDSTALAEKMNDSFESTRVRLRGTMNRMLRMAERTGVGWRVWVGFFAFVVVLFVYVWLF